MSAAPKTDLTLHEVAEVLGVHYMTAYRYVRIGELPAYQDGRRWMVTQVNLDSFRERDTNTEPAEPAEKPTIDSLRRIMEAGDEASAWDLLTEAGASAEPLRAQQELIAPALRETGRRWAEGEGTIAQEHIATVVATRLISRLGTPTRRGRRAGTVVVACPPGDTHTLATAFFANLVRGEGATVVDLGRVGGPEEILQTAEKADGNVSVALAVSAPGLEAVTKVLVEAIRAHPKVNAILIGGVAVPDETTALELGADLYFGSPETAAAGAAAASRA
ncbi:MAG: helix-turn-helix domain-containing protein [Acidimicrobiia bacterium]|nr:helix-turn-helix domain-containing protein [Acidimicrobiia bacterium]